MNKYSILSIGCAVLSISACDHYSAQLAALDSAQINQQDVSQISPAAGGGIMKDMTFGGYLKSEYIQLARYEQDQYDYKAAKYYTKQATTLSKGQIVSPASLNDFSVGADRLAELTQARDDLLLALHTYNIPENRHTLAVAQTRYDCWLDQQEESHTKGYEIVSCKTDFKHSMASLVPPDNRDVHFPVSFIDERLTLSEEAHVSLGNAVSFWKTNKIRGYNIVLVPISAVSVEENERQISMIRSILQFNGVDASNISVATPDTGAESFEILLQYSEVAGAEQPEI